MSPIGRPMQGRAPRGIKPRRRHLPRHHRRRPSLPAPLAVRQPMTQAAWARRLDPEQTLDEQAYAAALSFRWKQINHPHLRRKRQPKWIAVGFLLDAESEKYLLTLTQERIEEMKRRVASL